MSEISPVVDKKFVTIFDEISSVIAVIPRPEFQLSRLVEFFVIMWKNHDEKMITMIFDLVPWYTIKLR